MDFAHRVKSFLITIGSILISSFGAVAVSPLFAQFIGETTVQLQGYLLHLGIGTTTVLVVAALISELWRNILNAIKLRQNAQASLSNKKGLRLTPSTDFY